MCPAIPKRIRCLREEGGTGLAETMVALVILSAALLAIAGTSVRVGSTMNGAQARIRAMTVAERQLERLLSTPYDQVLPGSRSEAGVQLTWSVIDGAVSKEVSLIYSYHLPRGVRVDTLSVAVRQP